jgi:protein-disulfide isomerase
LGVIFLVGALACAQAPAETDDASPAGSPVVATVDGAPITEAELEAEIAGELFKVRQQMYDAQKNGLENMIYDRLVDAAAKTAGQTRDEYLKANINDKIEKPTEEEIQKIIAQYRARLPEDDEQARQQVLRFLNSQKERQAMQALRESLLGAADIVIKLDPPRAEFETKAHNPFSGPADAPVTLVEFTDFQCPYCSRVQGTLKGVKARYEGQVKHVFKHLPLPMHAQARLAAEASLCANDQGRFWEIHDWMFQNQQTLAREDILNQARALELDEAKFVECLDQKTHADHVEVDMAEAQAVGISGTPGFLINGRVLSGAQPAQAFYEVIEDELKRAGVDFTPIEPPAEETEETKETEETEAES